MTNATAPSRPADHADRMARARLSLEGLSVGDAFGERFFTTPNVVEVLIQQRALPIPPWRYTDDTAMALSIVDELHERGAIDQASLARRFADRYAMNPSRGYAGMARRILEEIGSGSHWKEVSRSAFGGLGSMGNGGAMRAAPIGAYFADNLQMAIAQALLSAEITHAHVEGQVGASAVAAAAAIASSGTHRGSEFLSAIANLLPPTETRRGIERAADLPLDSDILTAVTTLGNGTKVLAQDTVPLSLWCAAKHIDNFTDGMWTTVSALGDRDTTCAIVGGIVALAVGEEGIPIEWRESREPLKIRHMK